MSPQRGQVPGVLLAIDRGDAVRQTHTHQAGESHFGAIGDRGEHGFTEDGVTQGDEVKTCHQFAIQPDLSTVCEASAVQVFISLHHSGNNPSALLSGSSRLAAAAHDLAEVLVKAQRKPRMARPAFQGLAQGAVKTKMAGVQHHPRVWTPPQHGLSCAEPRKNTMALGLEEAGGRQVMPGCQQAGRRGTCIPCHCGMGQGFIGLKPGQFGHLGGAWHIGITQ